VASVEEIDCEIGRRIGLQFDLTELMIAPCEPEPHNRYEAQNNQRDCEQYSA
jgi:hypothetical protein